MSVPKYAKNNQPKSIDVILRTHIKKRLVTQDHSILKTLNVKLAEF